MEYMRVLYVDFVACKVCYHVLVVTFPMPHDRGCEIKIIVIDWFVCLSLAYNLTIVVDLQLDLQVSSGIWCHRQ